MPLINKVKAGPLQICVSTFAWKQVYFFTVARNNFSVGFSDLVQWTSFQEPVLTAAVYEAIRKQLIMSPDAVKMEFFLSGVRLRW